MRTLDGLSHWCWGQGIGPGLRYKDESRTCCQDTVSLTLVFSSAFIPSCVFSPWISCWVSASQFRTRGPTSATPGCSVLSFLLLQTGRFSSFQIQDYWGGRRLSWLGSYVQPGHISCGQGPAILCIMTPLWQLCVCVCVCVVCNVCVVCSVCVVCVRVVCVCVVCARECVVCTRACAWCLVWMCSVQFSCSVVSDSLEQWTTGRQNIT